MRARIDITEVETRTKIRAKYLRAIENEEWDLLPGPVYVKSFLRTYGDYLGLDSRMLVDEFKRRYERPVEHEQRPIAALSRERERARRGPRVPPWLLIAAVLVVVVVVLYALGNGSGQKATPPPPAGVHAGRPRRHRSRAHHKSPPAAKPKTVKLQLTATGNLYVCLVNGSGSKLIDSKVYAPGQSIPIETATKLLLTLGNNAVQMKVNGASISVPASPSSIGYLIQPSGTTSLPASKQPRCS